MVSGSLCVWLLSQGPSPLPPESPGSGDQRLRQGDSAPPPPGSSQWQEAGGPNLEVIHQLSSLALDHIQRQEIVQVVRWCHRLPPPSDALCGRPPVACRLLFPSSSFSSWSTFPGLTLPPHPRLRPPVTPSFCHVCLLHACSPCSASPVGAGTPLLPTSPEPFPPGLTSHCLGRGSPASDLELEEELIRSHYSIGRGISESSVLGCVPETPNGTLGGSS